MIEEKGSAEERERLDREREDADRRYNDALTALDAAIGAPSELPTPPAGYDESQLGPLNQRWELMSLKPDEGKGWLRRVRAHAWSMVAPLFERQQAFNAALVDHLNRNVAAERDTIRTLQATLAQLHQEQNRLLEFQTMLILWAQQITPYVDTKDRHVTGLKHGLAVALSVLSDQMQQRWEAMLTRERRHAAHVDEVRATLGVTQQAVQMLKREFEQRLDRNGDTGGVRSGAGDVGVEQPGAAPRTLDSYKYVGFEDHFRGSPHEIGDRLAAYVPLFEGARDVLDVGCGRGEFLELLREKGITARGIDINEAMAEQSRERGLQATAGDALSYLRAQPDASLGGVFAAQVVEHLEPAYLLEFLTTAYHKVRPGSKIVLETINAACWYAFFSSYIRDLTHVRPIHPETLRYLVIASGFQRVEIRYTAPYPEEAKLQPVPLADGDNERSATMNENMKKLNDLMFTHLDYAIVGERL
jgi:2-polyprenyl-3-methyl-5-hydroxy-6-metoxy-1,4-benzoquinol methylase